MIIYFKLSAIKMYMYRIRICQFCLLKLKLTIVDVNDSHTAI